MPFYKEALQNSDVLVPDGIGIVWAARILNNVRIKQITGADLHQHLLKKMNKEKGKVFYLGSATSTLDLIEKRVKREYPNIKVAGYSPPYKIEFTEEENAAMLDAINAFQPDIMFVGMTAPKAGKVVVQPQRPTECKNNCINRSCV